jgi:hypothetical protein
VFEQKFFFAVVLRNETQAGRWNSSYTKAVLHSGSKFAVVASLQWSSRDVASARPSCVGAAP